MPQTYYYPPDFGHLSAMFKVCGTLLVAVFMSACNPSPKVNSGVATTLRGDAQGTTYSIKTVGSNTVTKAEIDSLLQCFDTSLSAWIDTSVLARFNRADTITVSDALFLNVFWRGKELSDLTGGAFDPMVMPLVRAWGFGPEGGRLKAGTNLDSLKRLVTYDFTARPVDGDSGKVFFSKPPGVQLDVNAYAQGYSVDVVSDFLRARGIEDFMVEIGGEVYARGHNENGEDWRIGVDKPVPMDRARALEAIVSLHNSALATSGSYRKFYEVDGQKYSHTIDPRTGSPVQHRLLSASVLAPSCMDADAYATAFMVLGVEAGKAFLKDRPELGLEVYFIYSGPRGDTTYASPGMKVVLEEL